jgi:hypothetical protein
MLMSIRNEKVEVERTFLDADTSPIDYHKFGLEYWNGVRGKKWAPRWNEISLMGFSPKVVPLISVTDITPEPLASVYRFWGTKLAEYHGGEYTGVSPTEVPPRQYGIANTGGCGRLVNEKKPHLEVKAFTTTRGTLGRVLILRLPLSDDGESVNHGVNIYCFESIIKNQPEVELFNAVFENLK